MSDRIRVAVAGAAGRMGRAAVRAIARESDLTLAGALGRTAGIGRDAGEVAGTGRLGVEISADLEALLAGAVDVLVDFCPGVAAVAHARTAIPRGIAPVIGGTGLSTEQINDLTALCGARGLGGVIASF